MVLELRGEICTRPVNSELKVLIKAKGPDKPTQEKEQVGWGESEKAWGPALVIMWGVKDAWKEIG